MQREEKGRGIPRICLVLRQVLLNRLRSGSGKWHELAMLVPALSTLGIDNTIIETETGIERAQLNAWVVSVQVRSKQKRLCRALWRIVNIGLSPFRAHALVIGSDGGVCTLPVQ